MICHECRENKHTKCAKFNEDKKVGKYCDCQHRPGRTDYDWTREVLHAAGASGEAEGAQANDPEVGEGPGSPDPGGKTEQHLMANHGLIGRGLLGEGVR